MASYLILFLVFLLQFVYLPIGISHFEAPKVYIAEIGIFLLFLASLFSSHLSLPSKRQIILFSGIVGLSLIDLLFLHTDTTFFGNAFRLQGIFLLWLLLLFSYLSREIKLPKFSPYFILGIVIVQAIAALVVAGGINERAVGTLGEPNALAAAMLFLWPFLFFQAEKGKARKIVGIITLVLVGFTIFLSGSRSGMIGFGLQFLFLGLAHFKPQSLKRNVIICLLLLLCTYSLPFIAKEGFYEARSDVWQSAVVSGWESPLIGHGFGNTGSALGETNKKLHNNLQGSYVDSAHNIFLDWWVQGGAIGLILFGALLFQSFAYFVKEKDNRSIALLLGLLTALSFNPASVVSLVALWWLLGRA